MKTIKLFLDFVSRNERTNSEKRLNFSSKGYPKILRPFENGTKKLEAQLENEVAMKKRCVEPKTTQMMFGTPLKVEDLNLAGLLLGALVQADLRLVTKWNLGQPMKEN